MPSRSFDERIRGVGDRMEALLGQLKRTKGVIPYTTYGYKKKGDEGTWVIPLRVWVNKPRQLAIKDEVVRVFTSDMGQLSADEVARLRARLTAFVADDDSREAVSVKFVDDPAGAFRLPGMTDLNGMIAHELELPAAKAQQLLDLQKSTTGWLSFVVSAERFEGVGRVRLISPKGLSVISDIDDTIKVTEIPAGKRIVLRNVFLREYVAAPGMAQRYRAFGDDLMFHYVSGSPWQLYGVLSDFLVHESGFPEGAFHMKDIRKNLLSPESWQDFKNLAAGDATFEQKVSQITQLFENLPQREFVLIGDSGEKDPEVFSQIREKLGPRVREIIIRDVVDERNKPGSRRLKGMTVIEAPTVVEGVTQFAE